METQNEAHPSRLHLAALVLGKIKPERQGALQEHVANCEICTEFLSKTPRETLVSLLREARSQTSARDQSTPGIRDAGTLIGLPSTKAPDAIQPIVPADQSPRPQQSPEDASEEPLRRRLPDEEIPKELREQTKFRILRLLGRGGMGSVYKAEHEVMERQVAIKTINPGLVDHPDALKRFNQEVKAAARLDHANVARAYDADKFGSLHVLVMEFVPGQNLDEFLKSRERLEVFEACRLIRQAMVGLQHAHERQMVHRDLKPQNLMLTPDGKVKILDFGLAKIVSERRDGVQELTGADKLMGTTSYLAPEQARDAAKADIRADIYSLGCTLYCLIAGNPPFTGGAEIEVLLAHQSQAPRPLCEVRSDVPRALSDLVDRMLAKDPADRPQTPLEAAQALSPFMNGPTVVASAVSPAVQAHPAASPLTALVDDSPRTTRIETVVEFDRRPANRMLAEAWSRIPPAGRWAGVVGLALLPLMLIGWVAVAFLVRTTEGTIVVENVPPDAQVLVDGNQVTLTRQGDIVVISAVTKGEHKLKITRDGRELWTNDVTIQFAGQEVKASYSPTAEATGNAEATGKNDAGNVPAPRVDEAAKAPVAPPANERFAQAEVFGGTWEIEKRENANELVQTSTRQMRPLLAFGDPNWSRYNVTLQAQQEQGRDGFHICLNLKDQENARVFKYGAYGNQSHELVSHFEGNADNRPKVRSLVDGQIVTGSWYDVRVEVRGGQCRCYVNNKEVCVNDDPRLAKGRIGLGSWATAVRFRNIVVRSEDDKTVLWSGLPKLPNKNASLPPAVTPVPAKQPSSAQARFSVADVHGGDWKAEKTDEGETLLQASTVDQPALLAFGDPAWSRYNITLKGMAIEGPGGFSVVFSLKDENNFRRVNIARIGGRHHLNSKVSKQWGSKEIGNLPGTIEGNRWYDVRIEVRDAACRVMLDGKLLFETEGIDNRLSQGRIGLRTTDGSSARFKDIEVTSEDGNTVFWEGLPSLPSDTAVSFAPVDPQESTGFTPLFNGKDLTGWRTLPSQSDGWKVEDGVLIGEGTGRSYLYTEKGDFEDVHVRAEVRINDFGDSGILVRAQEPEGGDAPDGYEAEINPRGAGNSHTGALLLKHQVLLGAVVPLTKPGEWFTIEEIVKGNEITVIVNGKTTAHHVNDTHVGKRGFIALQLYDNKTKVEFRKIEVKQFSPASPVTVESKPEDDGFAPLFNGKDLAGWSVDRGDGADWSVEDGVLVAGGDSVAANRSYLLTDQEFENFTLRLQFRVEAAGEGGVSARAASVENMPLGGLTSSIDHPVIKLTDGQKVQTGTTRWIVDRESLAPAKSARLLSAEEWNTLELTVQDRSLRMSINNEEVLDLTLDAAARFKHGAVPALNRNNGRIGLEKHTGTIRYRNISVKELPTTSKDSNSPPRVGDGFVSLFNGRTLKGWKTHASQPKGWTVKGGILVGSGPGISYLYSDRDDYTDFHVRAEVKVNAAGNSGILARSPYGPVIPQKDPKFTTGYEAAISPGDTKAKTGAIYAAGYSLVVPFKQSLVAADQWFKIEEIVLGNEVTVLVNGKQTARYADPDRRYKKGHISLQLNDDQTKVEFRKIEVKRL